MLKAVLVLLIAVGATSFFLFNVRKLVMQVLQGRPEALMDHVGKRITNVLVYVFGHAKVLEDKKAGLMHMVFFYGFLTLQWFLFSDFIDLFKKGVGEHPFPRGINGLGDGRFERFRRRERRYRRGDSLPVGEQPKAQGRSDGQREGHSPEATRSTVGSGLSHVENFAEERGRLPPLYR